MFKRLKVAKNFYNPCYCAAVHLLLLIPLSFFLLLFLVSDPYEFIAVSRAFASRIMYYISVQCMCLCVYSVMYIFVRSKPTFESFCLPSSRH